MSTSAAAGPGSLPPSAAAIDAVLPQTQCRRCGYDGCRPYAVAIAAGQAGIDQCPPGGDAGAVRIAAVLGCPPVPQDTRFGLHEPLALAVVDEATCIGCTLCIQACPVDAIVGGAKRMHVVIADLCTGCELCLPPCPVDCIDMTPAAFAWDDARAAAARDRHDARAARLVRVANDVSAGPPAAPAPAALRKRAILDAAVGRARDLQERRLAALRHAIDASR